MNQPSEPVQIKLVDYAEPCVKEMLEFLLHIKEGSADSEEKD